MINDPSVIDSNNNLLRNIEKIDLPHKFEINLPHIQKIYNEENNNYIRNYYNKNKTKSLNLENSYSKIHHFDNISENDNPINNKIEPDQIVYVNEEKNNDIYDSQKLK